MSTGITPTTDLAGAVKSGWQEFIVPAASPYYKDPLVLVEGSGSTVTDAEGQEYLDFFCGILTTGIGHCHPEVVERVREQVGRLGHTSTLYLTEPQVNAARRLAGIAPGRLKKTFFTNSGTEAVETAVMLARMYTGRDEIIGLLERLWAGGGQTLILVTHDSGIARRASRRAWIGKGSVQIQEATSVEEAPVSDRLASPARAQGLG